MRGRPAADTVSGKALCSFLSVYNEKMTERKNALNRTAQCLRMLAILKNASAPVPSAQLAEQLQTNPRNIREYRRELEEAGYHITETRGRYGGYSLEKRYTLAVPSLNEEDKTALEEAVNLVHSSSFVHTDAFDSFVQKIHLAGQSDSAAGISYLSSLRPMLDEKQREWISLCLEGISEKRMIRLLYQSRNREEPEQLSVDPYEVISFDGAAYLIGWCRERKSWRTYRFSRQRMSDVKLTDIHFDRSLSFNLDDIIGISSIFHGALVRYSVRVQKRAERLFLETPWGSSLQKVSEDRTSVTYSFLQDSFPALCSALFAFGSDVVLLEPESSRIAYEKKLQEVLDAQRNLQSEYRENRNNMNQTNHQKFEISRKEGDADDPYQ